MPGSFYVLPVIFNAILQLDITGLVLQVRPNDLAKILELVGEQKVWTHVSLDPTWPAFHDTHHSTSFPDIRNQEIMRPTLGIICPLIHLGL